MLDFDDIDVAKCTSLRYFLMTNFTPLLFLLLPLRLYLVALSLVYDATGRAEFNLSEAVVNFIFKTVMT